MNYTQTLEYLYKNLPMFSRIGAAAMKPDLTNTLALCKILGNPENKFKSIHIAGTNGKGSVSNMLASVLQETGLKVGLYTSPHLKDFRERIRVNGKMIPEQTVIDFIEKNKTEFEKIQPSFFEWTVALCFDFFAKEKIDIAVIETGLGGRLDSTNVITPILSVITNIGWDHTDLLGNTLEKIAEEKAGIIKENIPVVIGEYLSETKPVFEEKSKEMNAPVSFTQDIFEAGNFVSENLFSKMDVLKNSELFIKNIELELGGNYQSKNILTVIHSVEHLKKSEMNISESALRNGLKNVKQNTGFSGRWHILNQKPLTICDTAHNVDGLTNVIQQIKQNSFKKLHLVVGMVNDKDISKMLSVLPTEGVYYFCKANIPRAMPANELLQKAAAFGLVGNIFESVKEAFDAAKNSASQEDLIFVGGSTFIVAEIL